MAYISRSGRRRLATTMLSDVVPVPVRMGNAEFSVSWEVDKATADRLIRAFCKPVTRFVWNGERYIQAGG